MSDSSQDSTQCVQCAQSPWLTVPEAAQYLRMCKDSVYALVRSGKLRSVQRDKRVFTRITWLDEYMESLPSGANKVATALKLA